MTTRRRFLGFAIALAATPALAHTPFRQWVVYRQKHLLIGAHRGDLRTYELAKEVVAALARELPEARSRVARGPRPERIASLIGTGQLFLTVLSSDQASRMARAAEPFAGYRPTPTHALVDLGGQYLLFAAPEFPVDHARLVTAAVAHAGLGTNPMSLGLEVHPGAIAFWNSADR